MENSNYFFKILYRIFICSTMKSMKIYANNHHADATCLHYVNA